LGVYFTLGVTGPRMGDDIISYIGCQTFRWHILFVIRGYRPDRTKPA
jgi:hypothetical protein